MADVTIASNWHKLLLRPTCRWVPQSLNRELGKIEEIDSVAVSLVVDGDELVYAIEVESTATVKCVAELVKGRVEWLEEQKCECDC